MRTFLIFLLLCVPGGSLLAQEAKTEPATATLVGKEAGDFKASQHPTSYPMAAVEAGQPQPTTTPIVIAQSAQGRSEYEIGLTYAVLAFTGLALLAVAFLAARAAKPWAPDSIIRVFGIILIIPLSVLLVVAGYSEKQIAPVIGLLGVIAGYLLGHTQRPSSGG